MHLLCIYSLLTIILSRIVSGIVVFLSPIEYKHSYQRYVDVVLCIFELFLIKQVWIVHKKIEFSKTIKIEQTPEMKNVKWVESIFEAIPQTVLQSVFLIRTYNSEFGVTANDAAFIVFSLFWSVVSAAHKFVVIDRRETRFDPQIHEPQLKSTVKLNFSFQFWICMCKLYKIKLPLRFGTGP